MNQSAHVLAVTPERPSTATQSLRATLQASGLDRRMHCTKPAMVWACQGIGLYLLISEGVPSNQLDGLLLVGNLLCSGC